MLKTTDQGASDIFRHYQDLADQLFQKNPAGEAQQSALLHWLLQETTGRIATILNNKYRSCYFQAAVLLAVLAQRPTAAWNGNRKAGT